MCYCESEKNVTSRVGSRREKCLKQQSRVREWEREEQAIVTEYQTKHKGRHKQRTSKTVARCCRHWQYIYFICAEPGKEEGAQRAQRKSKREREKKKRRKKKKTSSEITQFRRVLRWKIWSFALYWLYGEGNWLDRVEVLPRLKLELHFFIPLWRRIRDVWDRF